MSFYDRRLLPVLIHSAMRQRPFLPLREKVVGGAEGRVLELGIGSGLNLPLYRRTVRIVLGLDPSARLLARARQTAAWTHFPVDLHEGVAEAIPLEGGDVDTVVTTWTLCSVTRPEVALAEARRVLKPGGRLLFIEHGAAPGARLRWWQERITPIWRPLAGNCHLDRRIDRLIEGAGFTLQHLETGHVLPGPKPWTFHYLGAASA